MSKTYAYIQYLMILYNITLFINSILYLLYTREGQAAVAVDLFYTVLLTSLTRFVTEVFLGRGEGQNQPGGLEYEIENRGLLHDPR